MRASPSSRVRRLGAACLWLILLAIAPGMTCPATAPPPPTLPLPETADPPAPQELRAQVASGAGSDQRGSYYAGGALRGTFSPLQGMILGVELGGGARHDRPPRTLPDERRVDRETVLSGRILVGYSLWLLPGILSLAGEVGLTPGLHSELGGFVGPDATFSLTAGGRRWWAVTAGYRLAYMIPSRDYWSPALYHLVALTVLVPRRGRYAGFLQLGLHYGHRMPESEKSLGLTGVLGFRFAYGQ